MVDRITIIWLALPLALLGCYSNPGPVEKTGVPTDMAVDGNGFFIVKTLFGGQAYTRDGAFKLDENNTLVTSDGYPVQGYSADDNFNIVTGTLTNLTIPLSTMSSARATSEVSMAGNLNADGSIATQGTLLLSQVFQDRNGNPATANTLLTDLIDPATPGVPLFATDDIITLSDVTKGGRQLPENNFTVADTSILGDFASFLQNNIGINTDPAVAGTPGVRISDGSDGAAAGSIVVEGNPGEANAVGISLAGIRSNDVNFNTPFSFAQTQAADGESVYTSFMAYDSLGTPVQVEVTMVLDSKSNGGNMWRYYTESRDSTGASPVLGQTGTLAFNSDGQIVSVTGNTIQVQRDNTGAVSPLQIDLNFDKVTILAGQQSDLVMISQDGFSVGVLDTFAVGDDGVITGTFSNGLTRPFGQIALATFTNPEGLIGGVNNLYVVGPNSGAAVITSPQQSGAGRVVPGALELSNVDHTLDFQRSPQ